MPTLTSMPLATPALVGGRLLRHLYGVGLLHQADVVESTYVQGTIIKKYMYILISFFTGGMRSGWGRGT